MQSYRALLTGLRERLGIAPDETALTAVAVMRALGATIPVEDTRILRAHAAPELQQIFTEAMRRKANEPVFKLVGDQLDVPQPEAKRRSLAVLGELKGALTPWDDLPYTTLLERLYAELDALPLSEGLPLPPPPETLTAA
jgi:hypothetical protein